MREKTRRTDLLDVGGAPRDRVERHGVLVHEGHGRGGLAKISTNAFRSSFYLTISGNRRGGIDGMRILIPRGSGPSSLFVRSSSEKQQKLCQAHAGSWSRCSLQLVKKQLVKKQRSQQPCV